MVINIHAGHNADGNVACGAVGIINESTEARNVVKNVIAGLRAQGHTVYDCTVDNAPSQRENLRGIVAKCNSHNADIDVSVHFNAGARNLALDGHITGTEVLVYSNNSKAVETANNVLKSICELGFTNRGIKVRNDLYVLNRTNAPALLIECCFVDDADDCKLYNADTMAQAIVKGITGQAIYMPKPEQTKTKVVRITCDVLNIRSGPSTSYPVVGTVKRGEAFTIVEQSGSWGKLKSGAGWISINEKYVKEV